MQPETRRRLIDIRDACVTAQRFVRGHTQADYLQDPLLRAGVERQLMIVGEALRVIRDTEPAVLEFFPDHRAMIDFRNIVVHEYEKVRHELVWSILIESVPETVEIVDRLVTDDESES